MKKALAILICMMSITVFSKTCNLKDGFDEETIQLLKTADELAVRGILKQVASTEYEVTIVHSEKENRFVTFLGEIHIKKAKASKLGKKILSKFKYRFLEGVPSWEANDIAPKLKFQFLLMRILTLRFAQSTIHAAAKSKDALTIGLGNSEQIRVRKKKRERFDYSERIQYPETVISAYKQYSDIHRPSYVNFPLEAGEILTSSMDDSYVIDQRNDRMHASTLTYLDGTNKEQTPLILVGAAHVKGLTAMLKSDRDYETCDNF